MSVGIEWSGMRGSNHFKQENGSKWSRKREKLSNRGSARWDELTMVMAR
ncbi:hypothetical protein [Bifidobacterium aquikefiri]